MRSTRQHLMMDFARQVSGRSTCERAQVGSVITNLEMTEILAFGYNGNYRGGPNRCDYPLRQGNCGCIHSECNALVKSPYMPGKLRMFITTSPCPTCAKLILNAGISEVYHEDQYRDPRGLRLLLDNGVSVVHLPRSTP